MTKFIEVSGKTEDAAIQTALSKLGLDRDDVSVEILERAKSGFLGIGSTQARVKVSYEAPDEIEAIKAAVPEKKETPESPKPAGRAKKPQEAPKPQRPAPVKEAEAAPHAPEAPAPAAAPRPEDGSVEEEILAFLEGLLQHMGATAAIRVEEKGEGVYQVLLEGERLGMLIGHRGETLDAIQQLTSYTINRSRTKRVRIHLDAENYRAKREEALRRMANKVAEKVVRYRKNITLEPMNAYERHVVHEALQEVPDVVTYSTGTEPNRRTVVAYTRGKHTY